MPSHRLWAFERGVFWALDLEERAPPATTHVPAAPVTCEEARPDGEAALAQAMGLSEMGEIRRRFAAGSRCYVARDVSGAIAGYGWVSRGEERIGELERSFRLPPDEAYIWDCATLPPYRQRGVYTALLEAMVSALWGEGVRRIWIGSSRDNRPSLRGFARAGFQPVARVTFVRALGLRRLWLTAEPDTSPALVAETRDALREGAASAEHATSARVR
ncbi:MAG TPA: GNAT family N-acetyltransferase [Ktedonobacterales bacterium]|nr:GNAT family N-acetyltransferase [Ktedonobacterales bacterium]